MSGIHLHHWPGDPDRPALALHCMLGSGSYWGPIARHLDGRIDLRGFDMPGHGRSDDWDPAADDPDLHTAVTRIAASFIQRPLDLIGHSFGATVALRIAVAAPDAIRSLTLIEPVLFAAAPDAAQDALDDRMAEAVRAGDDEGAARAFLSVWGAEDPTTLPPAVMEQMTRRIGMVVQTQDALHGDSGRILREGGLEAIDAPVLIISGADSPPVIRNIADALAARLPDVGRANVPAAGHMLPVTHPHEVAGLIAVNLDRA
ncbi:alpha/beta fold hydrolase [Paracoccus rhizosphaerae]|uniref:Alpha/beta fold hydrolase n=1 Tax=Paracoccus rhizosphaerae TaxID=1133347 RepID=A0ABV6CFE0_9RHOB|nr:alpha/beta fold hydrolase [Paracoccus rhizosphaerae]